MSRTYLANYHLYGVLCHQKHQPMAVPISPVPLIPVLSAVLQQRQDWQWRAVCLRSRYSYYFSERRSTPPSWSTSAFNPRYISRGFIITSSRTVQHGILYQTTQNARMLWSWAPFSWRLPSSQFPTHSSNAVRSPRMVRRTGNCTLPCWSAQVIQCTSTSRTHTTPPPLILRQPITFGAAAMLLKRIKNKIPYAQLRENSEGHENHHSASDSHVYNSAQSIFSK